jgi:hypothetical protein
MIFNCDKMIPKSGYYCAPCSEIKKNTGELKPLEVWHSQPNFAGCIPGCEGGVSFKNESMEECQRCTMQTCDIDELLVECTPNTDSLCIPCPLNLTQKLEEKHQEYYSAGTCATRCAPGYALGTQNGVALCILCSLLRCGNGFHRAHECQSEMERDRLPTCVPCDVNEPLNLPTKGRQWISDTDCLTTCDVGWKFDSITNHTCVPCFIDDCSTGFETKCMNGQLECKPCDPLAVSNNNMKYIGPGNCTAVCVSSDFTMPYPGAPYCQPIPPSPGDSIQENIVVVPAVEYGVDPLTINMANATLEANTRPYPVRQIPHSAYVASTNDINLNTNNTNNTQN